MSAAQGNYQTLQEEYFDIEAIENADNAAPASNGTFIAIIALGVVVAVSLATVLSLS